MQKLLRATYLLVMALCLSFVGLHSAIASHLQGGQLTYESLGGNLYKVRLQVFRDCSSSIQFSGISPNLVYRNTGCSTTGSSTAAMTLVSGTQQIGAPYCLTAPNGPSPCGSGLPTNYETGIFETTVTLPPAAEWRLSVEINARPDVANINGAVDMYWEATLNNLVGGRTITNNSAQYNAQNVAVPFVCWKQQTTLNFTAIDADGDELVYELSRPLQGCNDLAPTTSYTTGGSLINLGPQTPGGPNCYAELPTTGGTYTATFPIPSFSLSGACPIRTATPQFLFNSTDGSFTFTPFLFTPGTTLAQLTKNKYVVSGKVSEYRRINNVRTLVGTVRRDIMVVVIDCDNTVPGAPVATGNNQNSGVSIVNSVDSTFIEASTCNYTRVLVRFTDPDPTDLLTVTFPPLDPGTALPGQPQLPTYLPQDVGTFRIIGQGTRNPIGVFDIQPDVLFKDQTFRIPVQIRDNGCPIVGQQTRVIVLSVKERFPAKVVAATAQPFVCAGAAVNLTATPTRPDSVLVGIGTPGAIGRIAEYRYTWRTAVGLNPADANKQNVVVRPTQTTRYYVQINAFDFRQLPVATCVDTASILVRVAPALAANFTFTGRGDNSGRENIQQRIFSFTNTSQTRATTDSARWTYRRIQDFRGNAVTEEPVIFSRQFDPKELVLRQGGRYEVTLRISNRAGGQDCQASEVTKLIDVNEIPNVFTPNNDGKNDYFVLTPDEEGSKVQIFNRWGRLVKEYSNYRNEWDGKDQPAGVYYYLLTDRGGKTTKGWVELAR